MKFVSVLVANAAETSLFTAYQDYFGADRGLTDYADVQRSPRDVNRWSRRLD